MTETIPNADDLGFLPPHEPIAVRGFHAYSRRMGIKPGETLDLRVSGEGEVKIDIVRHGPAIGVDEKVVATLPKIAVRPRAVHRGSYVFVERAIDARPPVTIEVWVRPLSEQPRAGIFEQAGLRMFLAAGRVPRFVVVTTAGSFEASGPALELETWHHLVGRFDGRKLSLFVDGVEAGSSPVAGEYSPANGALLIGAGRNPAGEAADMLTGDLCVPSVYAAALSNSEIAKRFAGKTLEPAQHCIGHWKFDAVNGARPYRDASPAKRDARPVNYPIRMIPGPRKTDDSDWCTYDPTRDADFGFAVRLISDSIPDCRWPVSAEWAAPHDLPSGQYAAKLTNAAGEVRYVHFIVRPTRPTAKMACCSTTNTRVAYNFESFGRRGFDYGAYLSHSAYPILGHILGEARPAGGSWSAVTVNFELPFYAWLDREQVAYDLYTEWDLEADPSLLDHYSTVAWAGHSEYWTATQYGAYQRFLRGGGNLLSMSGNTGFWRVSVDSTNGVVEVRKHDRRSMPGVSAGPMIFASHHHQIDHLPGGYMHWAGWPVTAIGMGLTGGWTEPPLDGPRAGYRVLQAEHPLFHSPHKIATGFPFAPEASGYETDASCVAMFERFGESKIKHYPPRDGSPTPTLANSRDGGPTILARAQIPGCSAFDYDVNYQPPSAGVEMWSEMLYKEWPGGGVSFAGGSVLAGEVLLKDENFSKFMLNVLAKMGIQSERDAGKPAR